MDIAEFNKAYVRAKDQARDTGGKSVDEAQRALRELLPQLATDRDREVAQTLIDNLPRRSAPAAPVSPLFEEAVRIQQAAYLGGGTDEERIAALADAQREIWAIADRAPRDESSAIRALTRMLEHLENNLADPPFEFQDPPPRNH